MAQLLADLSQRVDLLIENYKQIIQSIQRIPRTASDPEALKDLTGDIKDNLRSLDDDLDLVNLELSELEGSSTRGSDSDYAREKLRLQVHVQKLHEDLKHARQTFRTVKLRVKRSEDDTRRREREARLKALREQATRTATPTNDTDNAQPSLQSSQTLPPRRRKAAQTSTTEDDVALQASQDVRDALQRTREMLTAQISTSALAQEIMAASTRELAQLNESYSLLDLDLKKSKGLVTALMKSNKSDTYYLTMAWYIVLAAAAWLVWRRILWGPTWWLVWMPLRVVFIVLGYVLRPLGIRSSSAIASLASLSASSSLKVMPSASPGDIPVMNEGRQIPNIKVGRGGRAEQDPSPDGSLSQKVGRMVEDAERLVRGDGVELEDSVEPRNPKKRMLDTEREGMGPEDIIADLEDGEGEEYVDAEEYARQDKAQEVRDEL